MTDNTYHVAFSHFLGIGPQRFAKLVDTFGNAKKAYEASRKDIGDVIGYDIASKFDVFRNEFNPDKTLQHIQKKDIIVVTHDDPRFPLQLKALSDVPICLYVKGNADVLQHPMESYFGIVGTRKASYYGLGIASSFAGSLSLHGFRIVSGMALGIDTAAHYGTLEVGGTTIAVLGCGVDIIYPPSNKPLYDAIVKNKGAIISEFPPGRSVLPGLFVARNRIISGLSRGVLVVEGAKNSGALITARYAAEQGRDVFAPPVPITSSVSAAPNILLKEGAQLVTSPEDIIEAYNITVTSSQKTDILAKRSGLELHILELLLRQPLSVDDLGEELKISVDHVLQTVTLLEMDKTIGKNPDGTLFVKIV